AKDALQVLKRYELEEQVPNSILETLESKSLLLETRQQAAGLQDVQNIIIGDNKLAALAALNQAKQEGFQAEILTNELQGEAREVGRDLARRLRVDSSTRTHPFCWIAGGETTVTLKGNGKGGRNQELALAAVTELAGLPDVLLIALATDGDDGPTDAAGAVVTGDSARRAESLGLQVTRHLARNDAYPFFAALGDLLKTGPTGTNVNDLIFLFAFEQKNAFRQDDL
ncbi:MAG TPA: MOFRL family protein, partial [Anaerolineales bacterium]|nr:MOFRL family protein [Anaerolineales bacterium]